MSKFKQFKAKDILPKEMLKESVFNLELIANWVEDNEIEGETWEFVQSVIESSSNVEFLLKRKSGKE